MQMSSVIDSSRLFHFSSPLSSFLSIIVLTCDFDCDVRSVRDEYVSTASMKVSSGEQVEIFVQSQRHKFIQIVHLRTKVGMAESRPLSKELGPAKRSESLHVPLFPTIV